MASGRRRAACRPSRVGTPTLAGVIDPTLEWSTYLGGGRGGMGQDVATDMALDAAGNAYLIGQTGSADFPTTAGALDATLELNSDTFVTKIDPTGSALVFSTLIPGTGEQAGTGAIEVDGAGDVFVTGGLDDASTDFPANAGRLRRHAERGHRAVRDEAGRGWSASSMPRRWAATAASAPTSPSTAMARPTSSARRQRHPTTPGAFDTSANGGTDVFVTKLNPTGSALCVQHAARRRGRRRRARDRHRRRRSRLRDGDLPNPLRSFPRTPGAFDITYNGGDDAVRHRARPDRQHPGLQHASRRLRSRGRGRDPPRQRRERLRDRLHRRRASR